MNNCMCIRCKTPPEAVITPPSVPDTEGVTQMSGIQGYNLRNKAKDNKNRKRPVSPARKMEDEDDDDK
eukprot:4157041-Prymnesium_polylepis.1